MNNIEKLTYKKNTENNNKLIILNRHEDNSKRK